MDKEVDPVSITVVGLNGKIMLRLQGPITTDNVAKEVHELHPTMAIDVHLFDEGMMLKSTDCISDGKIITAIIGRAWRTSWNRSPVTWVDFPDSLVIAMKNFKNIKDEVPMLQKYAQEKSKLKDMPWMDIARKIADGINRKDERLDSGDNMMSIEELRKHA